MSLQTNWQSILFSLSVTLISFGVLNVVLPGQIQQANGCPLTKPLPQLWPTSNLSFLFLYILWVLKIGFFYRPIRVSAENHSTRWCTWRSIKENHGVPHVVSQLPGHAPLPSRCFFCWRRRISLPLDPARGKIPFANTIHAGRFPVVIQVARRAGLALETCLYTPKFKRIWAAIESQRKNWTMSQADRTGMSWQVAWILNMSSKLVAFVMIHHLGGRATFSVHIFLVKLGHLWRILFKLDLFSFSTGERRRRLTLSSSTPRCEDDCEDLRGAGGVLGGHWRRWRRALLGRSSSAPSSTADLGDLVAKFPQMEDVLQVNFYWRFVLVVVVVGNSVPVWPYGGFFLAAVRIF